MELPQVLVFDASDDEADAGAELARQLEGLEVAAPLVVASIHGRGLASGLADPVLATPPPAAGQSWAVEIGREAIATEADAIVAIGGGRCIDLAKLAAGRAGLTTIAVPTQLSHDGICSPVAVVPNDAGIAESLGAVPPRMVFVSLPTLFGAPPASVSAGLGDLMANPLALRDWALAAERGLEEIDQRAWDLSVESFELIEPSLDDDAHLSARDPEFLRRLADALILSGMAMIASGTSRPASGGEHEISHAIDELFDGRALHGAQVAFGTIISVHLYGEDTDRFRQRLRRLHLPEHPRDLGLTHQQVAEVLLHAPKTRPGRFTILERAALDEASALAVVEAIWGRMDA
ncbi:MAG TPA: iron-containing alcohol dehydrogenase [Actinomycetota bacterium]|nr:iron-containing alcohol dehydrogenase [Actinomycetota bacterium]